MFRSTLNRIAFASAILLLSLGIACAASAGGSEQQVCDVGADYALGIENYPEAIRLHAEVVRKRPDDALAHYHLGFAEGMMGNRTAELKEYQRAAALGLRNWDLFLNLGLAEFENGDLEAATDNLRQAVLLGEDHPESHFNLALVYERRGLLADAEREMLASLRLNPRQPDARNSLAVIYAEEGKSLRTAMVLRELVREAPDYEPARKNLALLGSRVEVARGETAAVALPLRPPSKPPNSNRTHTRRHPKYSRDLRDKSRVIMGALVQIKPQRFASLRAIVSPPRRPLIPARRVPAHEPRAFPSGSTRPTLPSAIRDEMLELYAFIFCQGGFRQVGMTFEQFLLVAAALRPADLPATREEASTFPTSA